MRERSDVEAHSDESDSAAGFLDASLTEAAQADSAGGRTLRRATESRTVDGAVSLADGSREDEDEDGDELPEISVMASGCLGLISFPREPGRVTLEWLEARHPRLIPALRDHPGIGFLLVRSARARRRRAREGGQH